jgi:hypothetical protein
MSVSPYNFCLDSAEDTLRDKVEMTNEEFSQDFSFLEPTEVVRTSPSMFATTNHGLLWQST